MTSHFRSPQMWWKSCIEFQFWIASLKIHIFGKNCLILRRPEEGNTPWLSLFTVRRCSSHWGSPPPQMFAVLSTKILILVHNLKCELDYQSQTCETWLFCVLLDCIFVCLESICYRANWSNFLFSYVLYSWCSGIWEPYRSREIYTSQGWPNLRDSRGSTRSTFLMCKPTNPKSIAPTTSFI